jgi:hypothetical protein
VATEAGLVGVSVESGWTYDHNGQRPYCSRWVELSIVMRAGKIRQ